MKHKQIMNIEDLDPEIILIDGYDSCFVGIVNRMGQPDIACYDYEKCIDLLLRDTGMTYEECVDFFCYNVLSAWWGDRTPCFIYAGELDAEED